MWRALWPHWVWRSVLSPDSATSWPQYFCILISSSARRIRFRSSRSDGLQLLLDECSEELHKRNPTDIELLASKSCWWHDLVSRCFLFRRPMQRAAFSSQTTHNIQVHTYFWIHAWSRFRLMPPCCNSKKYITLWGEDSWPFNHQKLNRTRF